MYCAPFVGYNLNLRKDFRWVGIKDSGSQNLRMEIYLGNPKLDIPGEQQVRIYFKNLWKPEK